MPRSLLLLLLLGLSTSWSAGEDAPKTKPAAYEPVDKELAFLAKQLKDFDPKVRAKAAAAIGDKGEDATSIARPLCNAVLDSSPKVGTAAIQAVEKVCPKLYKPLTALVVDSQRERRLQGAKDLGLMGDKAMPATDVLAGCLRRELSHGPDDRGGLTDIQTELFNAIRQIKPDDGETLAIYKVIAGAGNKHYAARGQALVFLHKWAANDEKRRKEVLPLVRAGLSDANLVIPCINYLGEYGILAKPCIAQLKQLKLSPDAAIREAAAASLDKIENQ